MKSMVDLSHEFLKSVLHKQAICVDATLGQGKDTDFFLSQNVHKVYGFEIQRDVFENVSTHLTTLGIYQSSSRGILVHGITNHLSSGYARLHNIILNPIHDRFAVSVVESPFEFRIV